MILTRRERKKNLIIILQIVKIDNTKRINNKLVKWKLTIVTTWEGRLFHDSPLLPCLAIGTLGSNSFQEIGIRIETVRKALYWVWSTCRNVDEVRIVPALKVLCNKLKTVDYVIDEINNVDNIKHHQWIMLKQIQNPKPRVVETK